METINTNEIEQATLAFVQGRSAADLGYAIAIMRAFIQGREAAAAPPAPKRGRPQGARNRKPRPNGAAMPGEEALT